MDGLWKFVDLEFTDRPFFIRRILEGGSFEYHTRKPMRTSPHLKDATRFKHRASANARVNELNSQG